MKNITCNEIEGAMYISFINKYKNKNILILDIFSYRIS